MVKHLVLIFGLALAACGLAHADEPEGSPGFHFVGPKPSPRAGELLHVLHDDERGVTCWYVEGASLACMADWQLQQPHE